MLLMMIAVQLLLMLLAQVGWVGASHAAAPSPAPSPVAPVSAPTIASLVKPNIYKRMLEEREIMTYANLEDGLYSFYATMLVRADLAQTRRVLTDYPLYAKMIPYVDRADYSPATGILDIKGGLWKFVLESRVRFDERGPGWLHYTIVGGHFRGMQGDVLFEAQGERGTAVYFNGKLAGRQWPPRFIIEQGAQIVFGFTGSRMRSYIEAQKTLHQGKGHDPETPQPRSRLHTDGPK